MIARILLAVAVGLALAGCGSTTAVSTAVKGVAAVKSVKDAGAERVIDLGEKFLRSYCRVPAGVRAELRDAVNRRGVGGMFVACDRSELDQEVEMFGSRFRFNTQ